MAKRSKKSVPSPSAVGHIGAAIRRQRGAMRMTVAQLANRVGLSRNTVTNYESGKTEPSASDLVRLADALGCQVSEFLGIGEVAPPPRFAFRAHAPLRKDPGLLVTARKWLRAYVEIEEITDTRLSGQLRRFHGDADRQLPDREIETAAQTLRQTCGLHDAGPENIASVLESLGVRCIFIRHDSKGLEGISAIQGEFAIVLLRDRERNIERTIFSGAHELGHLVLHPHLFSAEPEEEDADRDYEREADMFAGCFLVPSDELVRIWREERLDRLDLLHALLLLKRTFHVSFHCLFRRANDLGLAREGYPVFINRIKHYLGIPGKATMEELEPEPLEPEALYRTTRFERLVCSAFLQDLIGVAKVAEMLQVSVEEAKEITSEWVRPKDVLVDDGVV